MRDSQRAKLYKWERSLECWQESPALSLDDCRERVRRAYKLVGDTYLPMVVDGRGRRSACGGPGRIALPCWARKRWVVLHETAHSLLSWRVAPHGPEFTRLLIELAVRFLGASRKELVASARDAGLKIGPQSASWQGLLK